MVRASQTAGTTPPKANISRNSDNPGLGIGAATRLNGGTTAQITERDVKARVADEVGMNQSGY